MAQQNCHFKVISNGFLMRQNNELHSKLNKVKTRVTTSLEKAQVMSNNSYLQNVNERNKNDLYQQVTHDDEATEAQDIKEEERVYNSIKYLNQIDSLSIKKQINSLKTQKMKSDLQQQQTNCKLDKAEKKIKDLIFQLQKKDAQVKQLQKHKEESNETFKELMNENKLFVEENNNIKDKSTVI